MIKISKPKSHKSPICGETTFAPSALNGNLIFSGGG